MDSIRDVLIELTPLKVAFPNLIKVIQIALTICVSTASCERNFSALKRIKTYLRSTLAEQRLNDLSILSIEREIATGISLEDVITEFAYQEKHRIDLM